MPAEKNPPREKPDKSPFGSFNAVILGKPLKPFRYTEERSYAGDIVFAMGSFSREFVLLKAEPGIEVDYEDDELKFMAALPTNSGQLEKPSERSLPFLLASMTRAEVLKVHRLGAVGAAVFASLGGAGLVALLMARF